MNIDVSAFLLANHSYTELRDTIGMSENQVRTLGDRIQA